MTARFEMEVDTSHARGLWEQEVDGNLAARVTEFAQTAENKRS